MFQYQKLPLDVIKYAIIGIIILCLIIAIPNNKLCIKDTIILTIILTLVIAVAEHASSIITESMMSTEKFDTVVPKPTSTQILDNLSQVSSVSVSSSNSSTPFIPANEAMKPPVQQTTSTTQTENKQTEPKVTKETGKILYQGEPNADQKEAIGTRAEDDVIKNEMPYTDYHHLPLSDTYKPSDWEYGDSFLPPEKWYPTPPFPPVCVSEKRCPVCPTYTTGTPVDVKEWDSSRRITQPDGINTQYIKEKLNSGR